MNKILGRFAMLAILILIFYPSVSKIFLPGYFSMHDDTQIARVVTMGHALRNGQFPVRWVADLGYGLGYPIFNFYGPLPYYIGGLFYAFGLNVLTATKIMFLMGVVLSGITMFYLVKEVFGVRGAFVAATFYMYAPYHAVQIYIRGAVGEYYVLIFLPVVTYALLQLYFGSFRSGLLMGIVGISGIILSHTIFGYIITFIYLIFIILSVITLLIRKRKVLFVRTVIAAFIGGLAMSAFFWLPAFVERGYTSVNNQIGAGADYRDHFVCIAQFWDSAWGFGGSAPGCIRDGLSFKLGKFHLIIATIAAAIWVIKNKNKNMIGKQDLLFIVGLISTAVGVFFATGWSRFVWQIIPDFAYIQYPWRFLIFINFGLSVLTGYLVTVIPQRIISSIITLLLILTTVYIYAKYFVPQYSYQVSPEVFDRPEYLRWYASKISDEYLPESIRRPQSMSQVAYHTIPLSDAWSNNTEYDSEVYSRYALESHGNNTLVLQRAYFPGWVYSVNGSKQDVFIQNGLPVIQVPDGKSIIELRFYNTPVRTIANLISVFSLAVLIYIYYVRKTNA